MPGEGGHAGSRSLWKWLLSKDRTGRITPCVCSDRRYGDARCQRRWDYLLGLPARVGFEIKSGQLIHVCGRLRHEDMIELARLNAKLHDKRMKAMG